MFASLPTPTFIATVTDMAATNTITQAMGYVLLVCATFLVSVAIFKAGVMVLDTIMPAPANSHAGGTSTTTDLDRALICAATALLVGMAIAGSVLVVASALG